MWSDYYALSALTVLCLIVGSVLYITRAHWLPSRTPPFLDSIRYSPLVQRITGTYAAAHEEWGDDELEDGYPVLTREEYEGTGSDDSDGEPSTHAYGSSKKGGRTKGSFAADQAAGLQSASFSLAGNVEGGDARSGLDDTARRRVLRVMRRRGVTFDDARTLVVMDKMRREGIGADGRPRDPKFVSFGR